MPTVRVIAQRAAEAALGRSVPLYGFMWRCRCDAVGLRSMKGVLGQNALWYYECRGRIHTGWLIAGRTRAWTVQVEAATGAVLGVDVNL